MATIHLIIQGKVQGVFYRATAKKVADKMNLTGTVQNGKEGHVEIWASGSEEQLKKFILWCREGPSGAQVTDIQTDWVAEQAFPEFSIVRK